MYFGTPLMCGWECQTAFTTQSPSAKTPFIKGAGAGLWTISFGQLEPIIGGVEVNTGVKFIIPSSAQTDVDVTKIQLVWKVENVPDFQ